MPRLTLWVAVTILLSGLSANAAPHRKHKTRAAPPALVTQPVAGSRPAWASPQQCLTNDGYGRFLPCDLGDGR